MNTDYVDLNTAQVASELDAFTEDRYRQFSKHIPDGANHVLDIGCNTGRGGKALKSSRPTLKLTGLDCVEDRLNRLSNEVYDQTICGFSTEIPCPSNCFDVIVAGEFIEHLTYRDALVTLSEFKRALRQDGLLLMTTPFPDYIRLLVTGGSTLGGAHLSAHYPKQLEVMMQEVGFDSIYWRGSGKATWIFGEHLPIWLYGSFLIVGRA